MCTKEIFSVVDKYCTFDFYKMYSARKNAEDLKKALEEVVVPMFCNTSIGITEEQQTKLNKVLSGLHSVFRESEWLWLSEIWLLWVEDLCDVCMAVLK